MERKLSMSGGDAVITTPGDAPHGAGDPPGSEDEFNPIYQLYGPHRAGLPRLTTYARELWNRRAFAAEMSKASMRSANSNTFFGQAWLVLNPLLLAGVYFLLVSIIRQSSSPDRFTHLTCGLFVFTLFQTALSTGATSVTGSGKLLLNTAFPRLLIPLSAVRTAFFRFLPTVPVYLFFHAIFGRPWTLRMLLSLYFLLLIVIFSMGLAAFFAAMQVYFRDTSSFLPYFLRLWLYLTPILWLPSAAKGMGPSIEFIVQLNPMYGMVGGYTQLLHYSQYPTAYMWVSATAWAIGGAVIGFLFFMSREREFAVRVI